MYLDYYQLTEKPFQISTDPKFLWLSDQHQEALAVLRYGILDNKGFLLLTGDVGTGKTTLLNKLISSLGDNVFVAMVTDPGLAKMDFFNFVANLFGIETVFRSKGEFLIYLKNFLLSLHDEKKQALLIIDEAQNLSQKMLEEVRLLSNIEKQDTKLINIFFVGQSEFNEIILRPRNRAIRQRITINYNIMPLSEADTGKYIRFRLKVAGGDENLFMPRAVKAVFKFSNGYPRLINIICDQALLTGYVNEKTKIDEAIVSECADELRISNTFSIHKSKATPESGQRHTEPENHEPILPSHPVPPPPPVSPAAIPVDSQASMISRILSDFRELKTQFRSDGFKAFNKDNPFHRKLMIGAIIFLVLMGGYFLQSDQTPHENQETPPSATTVSKTGPQPLPPEPKAPFSEKSSVPSAVHSLPLSNGGDPERPVSDAQEKKSSPGDDSGVVKSSPERPSEPAAPVISLSQIQETYGEHPTVYFRFNANTLEDSAYPVLQMIASYCNQNTGVRLILKGYSDRSGTASYNMKLSEFRSDIVKAYLVGGGMDASRIETRAMGPEPKSAKKESQRKVVIEIVPSPE